MWTQDQADNAAIALTYTGRDQEAEAWALAGQALAGELPEARTIGSGRIVYVPYQHDGGLDTIRVRLPETGAPWARRRVVARQVLEAIAEQDT